MFTMMQNIGVERESTMTEQDDTGRSTYETPGIQTNATKSERRPIWAWAPEPGVEVMVQVEQGRYSLYPFSDRSREALTSPVN
jgi:hypothetical protein